MKYYEYILYIIIMNYIENNYFIRINHLEKMKLILKFLTLFLFFQM